jgi:hypothetical protein
MMIASADARDGKIINATATAVETMAYLKGCSNHSVN